MEWCLDCHRNPQPFLRPRDQVFNMTWQPPADADVLLAGLMVEHKVEGRDDCSVCHR